MFLTQHPVQWTALMSTKGRRKTHFEDTNKPVQVRYTGTASMRLPGGAFQVSPERLRDGAAPCGKRVVQAAGDHASDRRTVQSAATDAADTAAAVLAAIAAAATASAAPPCRHITPTHLSRGALDRTRVDAVVSGPGSTLGCRVGGGQAEGGTQSVPPPTHACRCRRRLWAMVPWSITSAELDEGLPDVYYLTVARSHIATCKEHLHSLHI